MEMEMEEEKIKRALAEIKRPRDPRDTEIVAIEKASKALDGLNGTAKRRVLKYLLDRYEDNITDEIVDADLRMQKIQENFSSLEDLQA